MKRLLFGHDETVAGWVSKKLDGVQFYGIAAAIGIIDEDGVLIGGAVLAGLTRFDVELSFFGQDAFVPSLPRLLAWQVFIALKCERCSIRVPRSHKALIRILPRFGFHHEGLVRRLYGPGRRNDALLFGLLREDAERYLKGFRDVGTKSA